MKSFEKFQAITIIPHLAKHSSLLTILETAMTESKTGAYDSIWCIFDRDKLIDEGISNELYSKMAAAKKKHRIC